MKGVFGQAPLTPQIMPNDRILGIVFAERDIDIREASIVNIECGHDLCHHSQ